MKTRPLRVLVLFGIISFVLFEVMTWYACVVDDHTMRRVLTEEGYTNICLGSYSWNGCPKSDYFRREFRATSREGVVIEGAVCCSGQYCDVRH